MNIFFGSIAWILGSLRLLLYLPTTFTYENLLVLDIRRGSFALLKASCGEVE